MLLGYLQASREHEGKEQSAAYARGDKPAGIAHGGRRGWLDSACYAITTALRKLDELRTWQERK